MIRIKVYRLSCGRRTIGNHSTGVADYLYVVKFLGIIVSSVTLHEVDHVTSELLFKGRKIIDRHECTK